MQSQTLQREIGAAAAPPTAAVSETALLTPIQVAVADAEGLVAPGDPLPMNNTSTLGIIDDDAQVRELLAEFGRSCGYDVLSAASAAEFLGAQHHWRHGCIIIDAHLADMDGLALTRVLRQRYVHAPVIVTIAYPNVRLVVELLRAGACDVLEKPLQPELLSESVATALDQASAAQRETEACERFVLLTDRERQVLDLVVRGQSSRLIAAQLGLSVRTVEIHRSHIKQKMGTRNAADLARLAQQIENTRGSLRQPQIGEDYDAPGGRV